MLFYAPMFYVFQKATLGNSLLFKPRPLHKSAWLRPCMLSILYHLHAIHKYIHHASSELVRLRESSMIRNGGRIENDDISIVANFQFAPAIQFQVSCGQLG